MSILYAYYAKKRSRWSSIQQSTSSRETGNYLTFVQDARPWQSSARGITKGWLLICPNWRPRTAAGPASGTTCFSKTHPTVQLAEGISSEKIRSVDGGWFRPQSTGRTTPPTHPKCKQRTEDIISHDNLLARQGRTDSSSTLGFSFPPWPFVVFILASSHPQLTVALPSSLANLLVAQRQLWRNIKRLNEHKRLLLAKEISGQEGECGRLYTNCLFNLFEFNLRTVFTLIFPFPTSLLDQFPPRYRGVEEDVKFWGAWTDRKRTVSGNILRGIWFSPHRQYHDPRTKAGLAFEIDPLYGLVLLQPQTQTSSVIRRESTVLPTAQEENPISASRKTCED